MNKTLVIYSTKNPYQKDISHISIQTETTPPYIFETYHRTMVPKSLPGDMLLLPIEQAKKLFNFKKGSLDDIVVRK